MRRIDEYESKTIITEMLSFFHDFCVQNSILYMVGFGTCIGAVRHKGFIPWDDDIDLLMTRDNYNKLLSVWSDTDRFSLFCNEKCKDEYTSPLPKLVDTRTVINQHERTEKMDLGLYIDIFVLDYVEANADLKSLVSKVKKISFQYVLATSKFSKFSGITSINANIEKVYLKLFSPKHYVKKLETLVRKYSVKKSDTMAVLHFMIYDKYWPAELFDETVELPFGDFTVFAPKGYDTYLRITYGDYMKMPPIDKQVSNHSFDAFWRS